MPINRNNSRQSTLLWAAVLSVALWIIPGGSYLTLPLMYFNTILHEFCHAIATVISGGQVLEIRVEPNGSGTTMSSGGFGLLISSAGYVGASMIGCWVIASGKSDRATKASLGFLAGLLAVGTMLWIRNGLGIALAVAWFGGILAWLKYQKSDWLRFGAQFLGMQQCLNAIQSLWVLLQINAVSGIDNDAAIASREFPLPPMFFALSWCAVSFILMGIALKRAWSDSSNSPAESQA